MQKLEEELQHLMENKSGSVRAFAIDNDIPYTTLKSMLSRGVMATNVSNVITICKALGIRPESLGEDKLEFGPSTTIHDNNSIKGDNYGIAGTNHGTVNNYANTLDKSTIRDATANLGDRSLQLEILKDIQRLDLRQENLERLLERLLENQTKILNHIHEVDQSFKNIINK